MLKINRLNINNGIFQEDSLSPLLFCIALIKERFPQNLKTGCGYKTTSKNKPPLSYGQFKVIWKNDDDLKGLLNTVKIFTDDIRMQFSMDNKACK